MVKQSSHESVVGMLCKSLNLVVLKLIIFVLVDLVQANTTGFVLLTKETGLTRHAYRFGSPFSKGLFFSFLKNPPILKPNIINILKCLMDLPEQGWHQVWVGGECIRTTRVSVLDVYR